MKSEWRWGMIFFFSARMLWKKIKICPRRTSLWPSHCHVHKNTDTYEIGKDVISQSYRHCVCVFFKLTVFRQRKDCTHISVAKSCIYTLRNSLKRATPLAAEKGAHIFETSASACMHGCVHVWSLCSSEASGSAAFAAACVHATWPWFLQRRRQILSWPSSLSRTMAQEHKAHL